MDMASKILRCAAMLAGVAAVALSTGCSANLSAARPISMGASFSPASSGEPFALNESSEAGTFIQEAPTLAALCQADHEISHLDLAIAFTAVPPTARFDLLPMFASTASPTFRVPALQHQEINLLLLDQAPSVVGRATVTAVPQ